MDYNMLSPTLLNGYVACITYGIDGNINNYADDANLYNHTKVNDCQSCKKIVNNNEEITITELSKGAKRPQFNSYFMSEIEIDDLTLSTFDPNRAIEWNSHLHQGN